MNPESDQTGRHDLEEQYPSLAPAQPAGAAAPAAAAQPDTGLAEHAVRARTGEPQWVAGSTQMPVAATRFVETSVGRLSYTELAERLAPALQAVDLRIRSGEFADRPLDEALLLLLHAQLSGELFPENAGRYRRKEVRVGSHEPPVPQLVREYLLDLDARMQSLPAGPDDLLLTLLAYAEGMLLSIHPFSYLNGRISRLWLTEILQRLKLPPVDVVLVAPVFRDRYLTALAAADRRDWKPLMTLWKERLSQEQGLNEIVLRGCTPTPLSSYLKALAVLRLVAEASVDDGGDPEATGCWRNDMFVLRTRLTEQQLRRFFLECYRPTPLLSPWNGRAGFLEGDDDERSSTALGDAGPDGESAYVTGNDEGESTRIGAEMMRAFTKDTLHSRFDPIRKAAGPVPAEQGRRVRANHHSGFSCRYAAISCGRRSIAPDTAHDGCNLARRVSHGRSTNGYTTSLTSRCAPRRNRSWLAGEVKQ